MVTIEERIGQLEKETYSIKLDLIELIKPFILDDWYYLENIGLIFNDTLVIGIVKRNDSLFIQNDNAVEYSLLSLSVSQLYGVYKYLSV